MSEKVKRVSLRCYGHPGKNNGRDGHYAVCLDLSLSTWRPTQKEAKHSLENAILAYVESVNALAKQGKDIRHLVPRPAALYPFWFRYYLIVLFTSLRWLFRQRSGSTAFEIRTPLAA